MGPKLRQQSAYNAIASHCGRPPMIFMKHSRRFIRILGSIGAIILSTQAHSMETQDENDALFGRDHGIRAEITKLLAAQSQEIVRLNSPGIQPPVVKVGAAEAVVMSP